MAKSPIAVPYDSSGVEKATAANPLRTDPTGTTAQPVNDAGGSLTVDATSLPLPTGAATEATLDAIKDTDGIKKITDQLPAGSNILGEVGLDLPQLADQYPEPDSFELGVRGHPHVDSRKRLITRSQVTSDEGAFRDDFDSDLETALTGTVTFTSGKIVTGSGTAFLSELTRDSIIRLSSDPQGVATRVDQIYSDTSLLLRYDYTGSTTPGAATTSYWRFESETGTTIAQAGTSITLSSGTTSGSDAHVSRNFRGPGIIASLLSVSQRIANQEICLGVHEHDNSHISEAVFVFDGTLTNKVKLRTGGYGGTYQESTITLPAGETTADQHEYKVELYHEYSRFFVDGIRVGDHRFHIPKPYSHLRAGVFTNNTGAPASSTDLVVDALFIAQKTVIEVKVSGALDNLRTDDDGNLQINVAASSQSLPLIINPSYEKTDGAIVANQYKRVIDYLVPEDYYGYLIRFSSYQNESSKSRLVAYKEMGTYEFISGVYTANDVYVLPQWTSLVEAEVTTETSSAGATVTLTVTYTNAKGVSGRTGTFSIPKSSIVGSRFKLMLQSGDNGVISIQSITDDSPNAGAVKLYGSIQLAYHNDLSNTLQLETNYQPGAIAFPTATKLAVEYAGGTVSKERLFDILIQLVPVVT